MVLDTALRAVYSSALLASGVELTPELSQNVAYSQMRIIELLLEQSERIESGETSGPYAPSSFEEPVFGTMTPLPVTSSPFPDDWSTFVNDDNLLVDDEDFYRRYPDLTTPAKPPSFLKRLIRRFIK